MKVLEISLFHPELVRGGAQQAAYELFCGLRQAGVEVTLLASVDASGPRALFKPGAIITGFDNRPGEFLFLSDSFDSSWLRNLNVRALRWFEAFLLEVRPDVIHFHHFLTYGLELLLLARRALPRAKLFLTLHEFLAICRADGHMVRRGDQTLCTHASPIRCHQCFPEIAPEMFSMREAWVKHGLSVIDGFIAPTEFVLRRYITWGLEARKVHVIANAERDYAAPPPGRHARLSTDGRVGRRDRFAFFGQLIDVKGLLVVFQALRAFAKRYEESLTFEINGANIAFASEGFRKHFREFLDKPDLPERIRVVDNGRYATEDLATRMGRIDWVILPSVWGEAFGLVLSEAFMFRRPPIASRIGALEERIHDQEDGLLFEAGDASALADLFHRAITEEGLWQRLSGASPGVPPVAGIVAAHLALFAGVDGVMTEGGVSARSASFGKATN